MARARSPMVERRVAGTRTLAVDAERSRRRESTLRLTAAGSTRTDTVVLLRLDSGALEGKVHKVHTRCVRAHAASAGSRAVVLHGRTCMHQPWSVLQRSAPTGSDQSHAALRQSTQGDVTVVDRPSSTYNLRTWPTFWFQLHCTRQVWRLHLQWLQRYLSNEILLTQQNKHAHKHHL